MVVVVASNNGLLLLLEWRWRWKVEVFRSFRSSSAPRSRQCLAVSKPFFDNAYNVLAIRTSSLTVDLLLLSCQIVMLATAAVPPVQAEDITT